MVPNWTDKDPIIEVKNLKKDYVLGKGGWFWEKPEILHAVNDISFSVKKGETLGIVGESGCGKSTAARLIAQLIEPTGGEVFYKGKSLSKITGEQTREVRRDIQMIFQNPLASLDPRKRILQLLVEPLEIHGIGDGNSQKEKAFEMLKKVGLRPEHAYRYPHEFSGGQSQRINIARALMLEPKIVICDEPVSALDVSIQAQVINLLIELQEQLDLTYLFISHDLNVVRYFCDRIVVMYYGKIVEEGESEKIYNHPEHDYTKKLLAAIPGQRRAREQINE
ncbi:MAG: ATP-binding cassette domain-containing protein [Tissierellia bacterium]|nr:ATP-binding cassette domain-containing protein [Tissierellia bacterium]